MGWHDIRLSEVASQLKTDTAVGLASSAARQRAKKYGKNRYEPVATLNESRFTNILLRPATVFFVAGAAFCAFADQHALWAVLAAVVALIDLIFARARTSRIRQVRAQLAGSMRTRATVIRDGGRLEIFADFLVPGDLIFITAGDVIPADARLVSGEGLFCDESALFGVGRLTRKDYAAAVREDDPVGARVNMVYCGCGVTDGSALAIVTATGRHTEYARLRSRTVLPPRERSPLEKTLHKSRITIAATAVTLGAAALLLPRFFPNALSYAGAFSTVLLAVGIALGFEPEADMHFGLSAEALELCGRGMTFKHPADIEKNADLSLVCSDIDVLYAKKRMRVVKVWTQLGIRDYDPGDDDQAAVLRLAALGFGCDFDGDDVPIYRGRDAKTTAVLTAVEENGGLFRLFTDFSRVLGTGDKEVTAAAILCGKVKLAVAVGNASILLPHCDEPTLNARDAVLEMQRGASEVIAVAVKKLRSEPDSDSDGFMAAGLIAVQNELFAGLPQYCEDLYQNGITPIILTAKSKVVAEAYARVLGVLCEGEKVAAAGEAGASDPAVRAFSDCTVRDCIRIIKDYRGQGETVAVIGTDCAQNNLLDAADLGVASADACEMVRQKAGLSLSSDTNHEFLNAVLKSRRCISALKNSALFGAVAACSIFAALVILFLAGRMSFPAAAALLIFSAVKFLLTPGIRRQQFKTHKNHGANLPGGSGYNSGAGYGRGAGMHALLVSIYLVAASVGCSSLGVGAEKAGSFIALACGVCVAALCFADEKSLFASALFSNKKLLGRAVGAFWAFALIGWLMLEPGAVYPFWALAAAAGAFPFSEMVKLLFKTEKRDCRERS